MPDAQLVAISAGRACVHARPTTPNPHHPRPWRRGSVFGDGRRRPLSTDERRIWLARAIAERRAGRLTRGYVEVADALLKHLGTDGQCYPSHATLACGASCNPSTVLRALKALQAIGLLTWERRIVRKEWPAGGRGAARVEQTSNAYELLLPDRPIAPREERRCRAVASHPNCGRQKAGETPSQMTHRGFPELTQAKLAEMKIMQDARQLRLMAALQAERAKKWHPKR